MTSEGHNHKVTAPAEVGSSPETDALAAWLSTWPGCAVQPSIPLFLLLSQHGRASSEDYLHTVTSLCVKLLDSGSDIILIWPLQPNCQIKAVITTCVHTTTFPGWVYLFFLHTWQELAVCEQLWWPMNLAPMKSRHSTDHREKNPNSWISPSKKPHK